MVSAGPGQGPRRADRGASSARWPASRTTASGGWATRRSSRPARRRSATGSSTRRPPRRRGSSRSSGRGPTTTATPRTPCRATACSTTSCTTGCPAPGRPRAGCTGRASTRSGSRDPIDVPSGMSIFPGEIFAPSRRWAERRFTDIREWSEHDKRRPLRGVRAAGGVRRRRARVLPPRAAGGDVVGLSPAGPAGAGRARPTARRRRAGSGPPDAWRASQPSTNSRSPSSSPASTSSGGAAPANRTPAGSAPGAVVTNTRGDTAWTTSTAGAAAPGPRITRTSDGGGGTAALSIRPAQRSRCRNRWTSWSLRPYGAVSGSGSTRETTMSGDVGISERLVVLGDGAAAGAAVAAIEASPSAHVLHQYGDSVLVVAVADGDEHDDALAAVLPGDVRPRGAADVDADGAGIDAHRGPRDPRAGPARERRVRRPARRAGRWRARRGTPTTGRRRDAPSSPPPTTSSARPEAGRGRAPSRRASACPGRSPSGS